MYKIIEARRTNLFLYQGNMYTYSKYRRTYPYYSPKTYDNFDNGIGFGVEVIAWERLSFNLVGGYAAFRDFSALGVTGEGGLYFKF